MVILNNIKQLRWEQNLTLRQLAKLSGVNYSTISNIENGQTSPTQKVALAICRGLNKEVIDVFNLDWRNM